jgi:MFS family permease
MVAIVTSPSLGAVTGGIVTDKCIGSYADKRALVMCLFVYLLFVLICISGPFVNDFILFFVVLWLAVFTQGFIEPVMMGIILNCVSPIQRATASSVATLIMTGGGYMMGPILYGVMS